MAISKTGTHTIADLLDNAFASTTVVEFGIERLNDAIQADLNVHNQRMREIVAQMAIITTERSTVYGTNDTAEMHSADEFSRGPTQKVTVGSKVEFPLDKKQTALGWTYDYFKRATVNDIAKQQVAVRKAHLTAVINAMRDALFGSSNFTSVDRFRDNLSLSVKRLVNADSASIPNGPNGETYDASTHTHYDSTTSVSGSGLNTAILATISDVVEHGHGGQVVLYINRAQEAAIRLLTDFTPYLDPRVIPASTTTRANGMLDTSRLDNRAIGIFGAAEVWVKPWVPADYFLCFDRADPRKPLAFRESVVGAESGLQLGGPRRLEAHPLMADYYEAFLGVGVWTRTNGAVLYANAGAGGSYVVPTF